LINYRVDVEFVKRVNMLIRGIEEQGCKAFHHHGTLLVGVAVYSLVSGEPRTSLSVIIEVLAVFW
jgi:hypothetical protein